MLVNKNMAVSAYTATFLENCARRIRKRNGGLLLRARTLLNLLIIRKEKQFDKYHL